jgi:hypothetical protein
VATYNLTLHCGAREITRDELAALSCPPPTKTWAPVGHGRVLDTALATLGEGGFAIEKMRLGVSIDAGRTFSTLDLSTPLTPDGTVALAVGVRNSVNKSYADSDVTRRMSQNSLVFLGNRRSDSA